MSLKNIILQPNKEKIENLREKDKRIIYFNKEIYDSIPKISHGFRNDDYRLFANPLLMTETLSQILINICKDQDTSLVVRAGPVYLKDKELSFDKKDIDAAGKRFRNPNYEPIMSSPIKSISDLLKGQDESGENNFHVSAINNLRHTYFAEVATDEMRNMFLEQGNDIFPAFFVYDASRLKLEKKDNHFKASYRQADNSDVIKKLIISDY